MTDKETRRWLGRARGINREIEALLNSKKEAHDQLTKITQNYQSDGAQSTKDPHRFDRLAEFDGLIDEKVTELIFTKEEILQTINQVKDTRHRGVLVNYYIRCKCIEEIADDNHISQRQIIRYRNAGIAEVREKLSLNVM